MLNIKFIINDKSKYWDKEIKICLICNKYII